MNEIVQGSVHLPDTIEDLTQFVLVGKARLNAYMLKIQNVNRLSMAQEIRDQTLHEAQELQGALFAAEQKIGQLLLSIPKQSGMRTDIETSSTGVEKVKTKTETISEMGYSKDEASRYQQMAKNPDVVQKVLDDAVANGTIASISQLNKALKENNQLKRELADRDRKIKELENRKSEVKTVVKEVVPDDYEELKRSKKAQLKDYRSLEHERMKDQQTIKELKQRISDLESRDDIEEMQKKLEEEAGYFMIRTYTYIQKNGGCVWITEKLMGLPEKQRQEFINSVYAIDAFAKQMVENIGGYGIECSG